MRNAVLLSVLMLLLGGAAEASSRVTDFVDPRIGSEGLGRVYVGPCRPFGMVKPSPDCTTAPNSGWLPAPEQVNGFAQVHVSGTGGGPKYGNILIQPYSDPDGPRVFHRAAEDIRLGYYRTEYEENGIVTEITAAPRVSFYRISYPEGSEARLAVDLGFFLGENPVPKAREAQQFEGAFCTVEDETTVSGWQTISGGWNNGAPYTVYFCLKSDIPFDSRLWEHPDGKCGADLSFAGQCVNLRIGISFLSIDKARENMDETPEKDFDSAYRACVDDWESLLSRISISRNTPLKYKRMFYTGLYHTMLMPSDRTGEWEKCRPDEPYYDDYYAIWDTYRTSSPLLTLLDPQRDADIVNGLLAIYRHDGYLPDARSGNSNGRTQGGSNAEIVIADAYAKGLPGIDWELALEAMLKDAEVPPEDDEAEGRGGLDEYNRLGYIPWGIPRAGNRTLEYAFCDYAISTVARGLGKDDVADKYLERSRSWRNLWRADYEDDGVSGFIMPRDASGSWLDELPFGHSSRFTPTYTYTPTMFEGPWYTKWWSDFFYEATSWEYSLSVPHDVDGLVDVCGGPVAFEKRLDRFFDGGYYNVNNEPSFLSPCLYHWLGRPDKSSARIRQIVAEHFDDSPSGLPGNDDSGAMSSWLAFHMMGLYPLAGEDIYLINAPFVRKTVLDLPQGGKLVIKAKGLSRGRYAVRSARLNGKLLDDMRITHSDLVRGGKLVLRMGKGTRLPEKARRSEVRLPGGHVRQAVAVTDTLRFVFSLHGQTRRYDVALLESGDTLYFDWGIERNLHWQSGSYAVSPQARQHASSLSLLMPEDGHHVILPGDQTFALLSSEAYRALKSSGKMTFHHTGWVLEESDEMALGTGLLHVRDIHEGAQMWILDRPDLPLIWKMSDSPYEQDWSCTSLSAERQALLSEPDRLGGIYYAYPEPAGGETPAPDGYEVFHVSHYGRHGSRYLTEDARYERPLAFFEQQASKDNLTPAGEELLRRLRTLWSAVRGRGGRLSEVGVRQHRGIARRLYARYPSLFRDGADVQAYSSTTGRCVASMNAFCASLAECDPSLRIVRDSSAANMDFIAYKSDAVIALDSEDAPWREAFHGFQRRCIVPGRFFRALLKDPSKAVFSERYTQAVYPEKPSRDVLMLQAMEDIYWIAVGMQNIEAPALDFYEFFTLEELFGIWRTINYRMYVVNGWSVEGDGAGPQSAASLLRHILDDADAAVAGNAPAATLRFGHDTNLLRLLALMGIDGAEARSADPESYWRLWQEFDLSPMAANLQMVFYRNKSGEVLVKSLLNEREVDLHINGKDGPYYPWSVLRPYLESKLN